MTVIYSDPDKNRMAKKINRLEGQLKTAVEGSLDVIHGHQARIKDLESLIKDYTETMEKAGDYHEQNAVGLNFYRKFKKLLGEDGA